MFRFSTILCLLATGVHGFHIARVSFNHNFVFQKPTTAFYGMINSNDENDQKQKMWAYPPGFHRAVECAKNDGLCDVEELLALANELEQYDENCLQVDSNASSSITEDYDDEIMDRMDVADLLRSEIDVLQRRETLIEFSNSFREKVEQEEEEEEAETTTLPREVIDAYKGFYENVYSKIRGL